MTTIDRRSYADALAHTRWAAWEGYIVVSIVLGVALGLLMSRPAPPEHPAEWIPSGWGGFLFMFLGIPMVAGPWALLINWPAYAVLVRYGIANTATVLLIPVLVFLAWLGYATVLGYTRAPGPYGLNGLAMYNDAIGVLAIGLGVPIALCTHWRQWRLNG